MKTGKNCTKWFIAEFSTVQWLSPSMQSLPCSAHLLQHSLKALIPQVKKSFGYCASQLCPASFTSSDMEWHPCGVSSRGQKRWQSLGLPFLLILREKHRACPVSISWFRMFNTESVMHRLFCSAKPTFLFISIAVHYLQCGDFFFVWYQLLFHITNFIQCFQFCIWMTFVHTFFGGTKYMKWCTESFIQ